MHSPKPNAPHAEWKAWANKHYPFDGRDPTTATGFDSIRAMPDRDLAADMAFAQCRANPEKPDPLRNVPPMQDYGYGNMPKQQSSFDDLLTAPDQRLPPERDE